MKKKNTIITLASAMAFLCVGGAFALNANTSVSADTTKKQIMLGASVLVTDGVAGKDANGIRFPVVVADDVAKEIKTSTTHVLPAHLWKDAEAPTAEQVKTNGNHFDTTGKWVNYYELNEGYGDEYEEAVVYIYNLPEANYATEFYVCSEIVLNDNTSELSEVVCRSMEGVALSAINSGAYTVDELGNYLEKTDYKVEHYTRTLTGAYTLAKTTTAEGYVGLTGATVTPETLEGYTYNASLTAQANKNITLKDSETTLACYYENDNYAFRKMAFAGTQDTTLSVKEQAMTEVDFSDLRGNTFLFKDNNPGGVYKYVLFRHYTIPTTGYMLLNVYVTENSTNNFGFNMEWGNSGNNTPDSVKYYDANGETMTDLSLANVKGNWVTIAVQLEADSMQRDFSRLYLSVWKPGVEMYLGEFTTITTEEFDKNLRDYTVTFNVDGGSEVTAQTMKYGKTVQKPADPEKPGNEFLYWTADGATEYNFDTAVTSDLTLTAVWEEVIIESQYTVKHYLRTVYGTYTLNEELTDSLEAIAGEVITATPKTVTGYTPNATLNATTATGTVTEDGALELAVYYENDAYKFETQAFTRYTGVNTSTVTKKALTGVPATDLQANTYEVVAKSGDAYPEVLFSYSQDMVGKYLVLPVYFTKRASTSGIHVWSKNYGNITNNTTNYFYDGNGKFLWDLDPAHLLNKWVMLVKEIPAGNTTNGFAITLCQWGADTYYFGEYTYLTEEQYKANFQYIETDTAKLPEGVVGYKGASLTYFSNESGTDCLGAASYEMKLYTSKDVHHSNCGVIPSGVTTWSAGQYVAVKVYSYTATGAKISLYGQPLVGIFDDAGNKVENTAVKANEWYTYVYKIGANDVTISKYSGSILVSTETTAGIKFMFESVYSIADDTAYEAFKTWKGWNA